VQYLYTRGSAASVEQFDGTRQVTVQGTPATSRSSLRGKVRVGDGSNPLVQLIQDIADRPGYVKWIQEWKDLPNAPGDPFALDHISLLTTATSQSETKSYDITGCLAPNHKSIHLKWIYTIETPAGQTSYPADATVAVSSDGALHEIPLVHTGRIVDPYDLHFRIGFNHAVFFARGGYAALAASGTAALERDPPSITFDATIEPPPGKPAGYEFLLTSLSGQFLKVLKNTVSEVTYQVLLQTGALNPDNPSAYSIKDQKPCG
jgi:hypothetical protein